MCPSLSFLVQAARRFLPLWGKETFAATQTAAAWRPGRLGKAKPYRAASTGTVNQTQRVVAV